MAYDVPVEPRFVVWRCDHCRSGIEFDAVQLVGRVSCRVPCPHCGRETDIQEPPPPPRLVPDEGWTRPSSEAVIAAPRPEPPVPSKPVEPSALPKVQKLPPKVIVVEPSPVTNGPIQPPPETKPITVNLPPDPPPPPRTGGAVDVRWLTDLGVVYFRQHQFGEAFLCFSRASEKGFAAAQFCLAVCYFNGHGTKQDEATALPWLQKAAAQGDANAEFTLGLAYRMGRGVAADEALASQWMQKAAQHGHPEAIRQLRDMNPEPASPSVIEVKSITPVDPKISKPEMNAAKPTQDLQRLILGLFRKK